MIPLSAQDPAVFALLVKVVLGALASFLAIIAWTRAGSAAWVFIVASVLAHYAGVLYAALRLFGLLAGPELLVAGYPIGSLISENLSIVLVVAALVSFLRSGR